MMTRASSYSLLALFSDASLKNASPTTRSLAVSSALGASRVRLTLVVHFYKVLKVFWKVLLKVLCVVRGASSHVISSPGRWVSAIMKLCRISGQVCRNGVLVSIS
jgi:hypothetical protein